MQSQGQVDFQLLHYEDATMADAKHRWELTPGNTVLHLDYTQKGLGNGSCGQGTGTLNEYLCPTGSGVLTNTVRFRPYTKDEATGIDEISAATASTLSVNCANGIVTATGAIEAGTTFTIYDLGGAVVAQTTAATATNALTLNIKAQPYGSYIAKVGSVSYKIVK